MEPGFVASSQVVPRLLVHGPHFEKHGAELQIDSSESAITVADLCG